MFMSRPLPRFEPPTGITVGTYDTYEAAQRAVDYLSDNQFPVENVTIVGNDLRMVERVTGRLTQGRAAGAGAAAGAWWGLFIGAMLTLFASENTNWVLLILLTVLIGAVFGAVMGMIGYSLTGGKRDFTSTSSVVATTYDVLCRPSHAEEARNHLAKLSLQG